MSKSKKIWSAQGDGINPKKTMTRITGMKAVGALTGVSTLLAGCAGPAQEALLPVSADIPGAMQQTAVKPEVKTMSSSRLVELDLEQGGFTMSYRFEKQMEGVTHIPHVQGQFSFNQDVLTPNSTIFNLFGTAVVGVCSAPPAESLVEGELENWEISVEGDVENAYTTKLVELAKSNAKTRTMSCACSANPAGGSIIANAEVTGVPLKDIIEMAGINPGVNTVRVVSDDGYEKPMPLSYVLDREALLVYKINGEDVPLAQGNPVQLWMPSSVAKYFTRRVVSIKLTAEESIPELAMEEPGPGEFVNRPNIAILNYAEGHVFKAGQPVTFEGYADDYDKVISSVEFSMDEGQTWTSFDTANSTSDKWVYWYFTFTPDAPGKYALDVRSKTADGEYSPLSSTMVFMVE